MDQIFTLAELLRGSWEFDRPVYSGLTTMFSKGFCGECCGSMGYWSRFCELFGPSVSKSCVHILGLVYSEFWSLPEQPLVTDPVCDFHRQDLKA